MAATDEEKYLFAVTAPSERIPVTNYPLHNNERGTNMTIARRLDWPSYIEKNLCDVVTILNAINPRGYTAADIKAHVEREFYDNNLDSYVGTAGWYVTVYKAPTQNEAGVEVWNALPTIMPYSIERFLEAHKLLHEVTIP